MASAESQKSTCPVCNKADQVVSIQKAYQSGVTRCAPPDLPTRNVSMMKPVTICGIIVGICIFLIIVFIGGLDERLTLWAQYAIAAATLVTIVTSLVVSYIAFQRVVRGDNEAQQLYPAWEQANNKWKSLSYCKNDDVVFDPETNRKVSDEQLKALRASSQIETPKGQVQSALARH